MWKDHRRYGYEIDRTFRSKKNILKYLPTLEEKFRFSA